MELELLPLVFGGIAVLLGAALVADGWIPDSAPRMAERRRRARVERDRTGEIGIGIGIVAVGAALIGRDAWRYGTVAVLVGVALVLFGAVRNFRYLRERLVNRGAARRGRASERRHEGEHVRPRLVDDEHDRRGPDRRHAAGEGSAAEPSQTTATGADGLGGAPQAGPSSRVPSMTAESARLGTDAPR